MASELDGRVALVTGGSRGLGRAVLPGMRDRRRGRIVNIGSDVVARPLAGLAAYITAKAAPVGLTRAWAHELGGHGVTVNLVAPGFVPVERHGEVTEADRREYVEGKALDRMAVPEDVAEVVTFPVSDRAAFVTGQVLAINGGRTFAF